MEGYLSYSLDCLKGALYIIYGEYYRRLSRGILSEFRLEVIFGY